MPAPSQTDLIAPFDPTGYASITGAQLLQLISGAIPYTDKGFTVITADIAGVAQPPDATITTKWQTYIWIRQSATSIGVYVWNPTAVDDVSVGGVRKWQPINIAAIGAGAINGTMIATNTISYDKIISVLWSQIQSPPSFLINGTAAGGDLSGTYTNPTIAPLAVTASKIALNTITHAQFAAQAVQIETDVRPSAVANTLIRTNGAVTALEHFVPGKITLVSDGASAADVGKTVIVANPYTNGFTTTIPGIAQHVTKALLSNAGQACTTVIPFDYTIPLIGEGDQITGSNFTFTPIYATTLVRIQVALNVSDNTGGGVLTVALFNGATCLQARSILIPTANYLNMLTIDCVVAPAGAALTLSLRAGPAGATTAYIERNATGTIFTTPSVAFMSVTELVGTLS